MNIHKALLWSKCFCIICCTPTPKGDAFSNWSLWKVFKSWGWSCYQKVWGLAAHRPKSSKQARLVERNVCFISDAGNSWGGRTYVQRPTLHPNKQRVRAFTHRVGSGGCYMEKQKLSLTLILKLVISGLTSVILVVFSSVQSLSHVWLCDPMDCSMPGFLAHHPLPKLAQIHVHWVGDAI